MDGSLYNAVVKADGADGPPLKANGTYIFKQKNVNLKQCKCSGFPRKLGNWLLFRYLCIHIHLCTEMKSVSQLLQIPERAGIGVVLGVDGDTLEDVKNILYY